MTGLFGTCYVVARVTEDCAIDTIMAVYPTEELANEAIEELYRDDYNEFKLLTDADTCDQYRECPVSYYTWFRKPMWVEE